jgi:beta-galactosidase
MSRTRIGKRTDPAPLPPRERTSFDAEWLFHLGDVEAGQAPDLDARRWRKLELPHDWSIEGPIAEENPAGAAGGFYPGGIAWYRKAFTAPAAWAGRKVAVEFDGVYWHSDVWINGHHLGHRPNGYVSFQYDLTDHLDIGGPNVLAVRVDNSRQPNSRWYSGSGIYRHVWMNVTGRLHLARWSPCITTPQAGGGEAAVAVSSIVRNETGSAAAVTVHSTVLDNSGRAVAAAESGDSIPAGHEHHFEQVLTVGDPDLWSPDAPSLYTLRSEVLLEGKVVDAVDTTFGIRSVVFDADRGLLLNGRPVKMRGVCEHHDGGCVGAAVPDAVIARRLRILKDMGCNAIRTAHNPPSPVLLDLCDRMGFLVIDEAFDEWMIPKKPHGYATLFEKWWRRDLDDWIHRDRNHPCVILWSLGNEIREQFSRDGVEIARRLIEAVSRLDPTRPATCGCNWLADEKVWIAPEFAVIGINGGGGGCFQYENFHRDNPGWKLYASEVPHTLQTRGVYQTVSHYRDKDPRGGILKTPDLAEPEVFGGVDPNYRSAYDNAYVRTNCRNSWAATKKHDFLAGEFRWSGFDYLGESLGWPRRCWNFGIIDLCGFPKDSYYFYQSQWTAEPMVHILPHWTWPGKEGVSIPVVAYSNCEEVELLLNGRSLGRKPIVGKMDLTWLAPYEPGALKAIAYKAGRPAAEKQYTTAGPPAAIRLTPDRQTIAADGKDVVHATVEIVDAAGNLVPHADNRVRFEVSGPGRIIGVDNGNPLDIEPTKADNRKAFFGMCLAIVQSAGQAGTLRIAAGSDALCGDEALISTSRDA